KQASCKDARSGRARPSGRGNDGARFAGFQFRYEGALSLVQYDVERRSAGHTAARDRPTARPADRLVSALTNPLLGGPPPPGRSIVQREVACLVATRRSTSSIVLSKSPRSTKNSRSSTRS